MHNHLHNPFLSPTYAKTGGYPLPENVGTPTFSIFPHIFCSFSPDLQNEATARAIKECWPRKFVRGAKGAHKSQRHTAECGEGRPTILAASGRALPASGQAHPASGQAVGGPYMENAECELAGVGDDPVGEGVP